MGLFIGGFLAVAIGITVIYLILRQKIRNFSSRNFGNPDILEALDEIDAAAETTPRSLNGCDRLLMPQILRDFPDFDSALAITYVRDQLQNEFGHQPEFTIYRVVTARYLRSNAQKTIIYQAAVSWNEDRRVQKRFDLHYTYLLPGHSDTIAANCPNCGGALGYGMVECPFCHSRVAAPLGNTWKVTAIIET